MVLVSILSFTPSGRQMKNVVSKCSRFKQKMCCVFGTLTVGIPGMSHSVSHSALVGPCHFLFWLP